jgi:hypothetical protein
MIEKGEIFDFLGTTALARAQPFEYFTAYLNFS